MLFYVIIVYPRAASRALISFFILNISTFWLLSACSIDPSDSQSVLTVKGSGCRFVRGQRVKGEKLSLSTRVRHHPCAHKWIGRSIASWYYCYYDIVYPWDLPLEIPH